MSCKKKKSRKAVIEESTPHSPLEVGSLPLKKNLHVKEPLSTVLKGFSTHPHPQPHILKYK